MTVVSRKCCQNKLHYRRQIIVSVHWPNLILLHGLQCRAMIIVTLITTHSKKLNQLSHSLDLLHSSKAVGTKLMVVSCFVIIFLDGVLLESHPLSNFLQYSSQPDLGFMTDRCKLNAEIPFNPLYRRSQPYVDLTESPWESSRLKTRSHLFAVSRQAIPSTHLKKKRKWDLF